MSWLVSHRINTKLYIRQGSISRVRFKRSFQFCLSARLNRSSQFPVLSLRSFCCSFPQPKMLQPPIFKLCATNCSHRPNSKSNVTGHNVLCYTDRTFQPRVTRRRVEILRQILKTHTWDWVHLSEHTGEFVCRWTDSLQRTQSFYFVNIFFSSFTPFCLFLLMCFVLEFFYNSVQKTRWLP